MFSLLKENNDDTQEELDFRCPNCKWYFSSITKPFILPCNHNICIKCIDLLISENRTSCPICNSKFKKEERDSFQINLVFLNILLKILQTKIIFCKNCNQIYYWKEHYNICEQSFFSDTSKIFHDIKFYCEEGIRILKLFDSHFNILFKYKKNIYDGVIRMVKEISENYKKELNSRFSNLFLTSNKIDFIKSKKDLLSFLEACLPYNKYFNTKEITYILQKYNPSYCIQTNIIYKNNRERGLSPIQPRIVPHSPFAHNNLSKIYETKKSSTIMISQKDNEDYEKKQNKNNMFRIKRNNNLALDKYDNLFNKMLNDTDNLNINAQLKINNINSSSLKNHINNFYAQNTKANTVLFNSNTKEKNKKNKFNIYDILNEKEPNEEDNTKKIIIGLKDVKVISEKNSQKNLDINNNSKNIIRIQNKNIDDNSEISTIRIENPSLYLLRSNDLTKRIMQLNGKDKKKKLLLGSKKNININQNKKINEDNEIYRRRERSQITLNRGNFENENENQSPISSINKLFKHFNKVKDIINEINNFNKSLLYISDYISKDIDLNKLLLDSKIYNDYNLLLNEISYNYSQYPRRYVISYIHNTKKLFLYNTILNNYKTKDFEKILQSIEPFNDSMSIDFNDDDLIFISGGKENSDFNCSNKFIILKWSIENIEYNGTLPNRKAYHSSLYFDNKVYIIGGIDSNKKISKKCFYFTIKDKKWHSFPSLNKGRANCSLCVYNNKILYAFRGKDDEDVMDTIEYIKLYSNKYCWKIIKPKDIGFIWNPGQNSLVMTVEKGKILILGGEDKDGNLYNDTLLFETDSKKVYKGIDLASGAAFKSQGGINQGRYFCADFKNEDNINNSKMCGIHIYNKKENIWNLI